MTAPRDNPRANAYALADIIETLWRKDSGNPQPAMSDDAQERIDAMADAIWQRQPRLSYQQCQAIALRRMAGD